MEIGGIVHNTELLRRHGAFHQLNCLDLGFRLPDRRPIARHILAVQRLGHALEQLPGFLQVAGLIGIVYDQVSVPVGKQGLLVFRTVDQHFRLRDRGKL